MKRLTSFTTTVALLAAGLVFVFLSVTVAQAQPDHLHCFKAKDSAKFNATATLSALQTQFGFNEECQIKGKGKLFCVPVTKTVTAFEDKSKDGIDQVELPGQELEDDRVCYRIKCPKKDIPAQTVIDQFGTRTMEKFKSQLLCTPAIKGTPPATTTTTTPTTSSTATTTTTPSTTTTTTTTTTTLSPVCPTDGSAVACSEVSLDLICGDCCANSLDCGDFCFSAEQNFCDDLLWNAACAEAVNAGGCAEWCCP